MGSGIVSVGVLLGFRRARRARLEACEEGRRPIPPSFATSYFAFVFNSSEFSTTTSKEGEIAGKKGGGPGGAGASEAGSSLQFFDSTHRS
jgi:hypothetical protein